jgi:heme oxygenase (mycobilin-producing)
MIAITHLHGDDTLESPARDALAALAAQPGYLRGQLARATDDPTAWVLVTEWRNVGSYRRALGAYDVKLRATPLFAAAVEGPAGFETLLDIAPDGTVTTHASDLAADAE